jgi:hypothetical protein
MVPKHDVRSKAWETANPNSPRFWFLAPPFRESNDGDKDWGLPLMVQVRSRSGVSTPAASSISAIHL